MTPATDKSTNIAQKMKTVNAAWAKALEHYQVAEKAHTATNDSDTDRALDAAPHALA